MKTKILLFTTMALMAVTSNAKIWRVNNNNAISADFRSLQAAIDSVDANDTIYVEGSSISYAATDESSFFITKALTIIGPGYFLGENDSTLFLKTPATLSNRISILPDAEGTTIKGLIIPNAYIGASNITIIRNYIQGDCRLATYFHGDTAKNILISNVIFNGNYFKSAISDWPATAINSFFTNNIIATIELHGGGNTITNNTLTKNSLYGFSGSVNGFSIVTENANISNNICLGKIYTGYNTSTYPVEWISANNTLNNNFTNINASDHYIGETENAPDKQYMLKADSPAIGAGVNGEDCGAFGGIEPYVLSGLPPIPHIYELSAPLQGSAHTGLPVKIKVKTQN